MAAYRIETVLQIVFCVACTGVILNDSKDRFQQQKENIEDYLHYLSNSQSRVTEEKNKLRHYRTIRQIKLACNSNVNANISENQRISKIIQDNIYQNQFINVVNIIFTWVKEDDSVILVVTTGNNIPSQLFISENYGKNFTNASERIQGSYISSENGLQQSPLDRKRVILVGHNQKSAKTILDITENSGKTFNSSELEFHLVGDILFHPFNASRLLAKSSSNKKYKLWLSEDFAHSWIFIDDYVDSVQWSSGMVDNNDTFFWLATNPKSSKNSVLKKTTTLGRNFTTVCENVLAFNIQGIFIYSLVSTKKNYILQVSTTGGLHWNEVQLPTSTKDQYYTILDMSENMIFMDVYNETGSSRGSLYISDARGVVFSQSLRGHLNGVNKSVTDFYKVESMRGVYLTSQKLSDSSIKTMVTFNRGAIWSPIRKPDNVKCDKQTCSLYIHNQYSRSLINYTMGPLSSENAVGLILAHGTVGDGFEKVVPDVFISSDGGYNWYKALDGPHLYAIANHGALLVAIPDTKGSDEAVNTLKFSTDEGQTWHCTNFTTEPLVIRGLHTEPGFRSPLVLIGGFHKTSGIWSVIAIDFKSVLGKTCKEPDDFESFVAHSDIKDPSHNACLLGLKETFRKLKKSSWCYMNYSHQIKKTAEICPCTYEDFECDFGYVRVNINNESKCIEDPKFKGEELDVCLDGEEETIETDGYRKIPGDKCENGVHPAPGAVKSIHRKCNPGDKYLATNLSLGKELRSVATITVAVIVVLVILITFGIIFFFVRRINQLRKHDVTYHYSLLSQADEWDYQKQFMGNSNSDFSDETYEDESPITHIRPNSKFNWDISLGENLLKKTRLKTDESDDDLLP